MKDNNSSQKEKSDNLIQDYINNLIASPKQEKKDTYTNSLLSPEQTMNQKFFPSKENYFGIKTSPNNNLGRPVSPVQSPILNYYAGLSPKAEDLNNISPKNDGSNLNGNTFSGKLSPNFNYSPSTIFVHKSSKEIKNINNLTLQNNTNNNEDDYKTLQEKMAPFVRKTDANNFIRKSSFPSNNNLEEKNEHSDEDEDDENEETFTLTFDNFDEEYLKEPKANQYTENISIQKKPSNSVGVNSTAQINNNSNEQINPNINEQKPLYIQENQTNLTTDNSSQQEKESLVKNIINKQEFKPYIPNKYRNLMQKGNNFHNAEEEQIYPSYQGNKPMEESNNLFNFDSLPPEKIGQYLNFPNERMIGLENSNKFSIGSNNNYIQKQKNEYDNENLYNNFYYNGDNYKISNFKEYKKKDYSKTGEIPSISAADIVTAITANNKKIKRIDPNTYLNESIEYLSYNIFPLAKDQAGCRFLQEKIEKDPTNTTPSFYKAIIPYILPLAKDPFGNYLIQKLFYYLSPDQIQKILEILTPTILDIGSNSHGTRVIQNIINFLSTKELVNSFLNSIKPYVIPLLKELNGTHIINKFTNEHPECSDEINKIIVDNCSLLATHRHGCCILQKMLEGSNKKLKNSLINNLIENCFVLIIDQFGNYVIQSILLLNESKLSSAIAMKICDNIPYYSKHRYSSNVIEKCFDFCGKKDRKKLIEKISTPEIISDLILDEHGNYVVQKALCYADSKEKEIILNNIRPMIPKIRNMPFGEKLLFRLFSLYPQLESNVHLEKESTLNEFIGNNNFYNNNFTKNKGAKKKGKKKKKKNNNNNDESNNNKSDLINSNKDNFQEINKDVSMNNYYSINNNTINININSNNDTIGNIGTNTINLMKNNNSIIDNINKNTLENNNMVDNQSSLNNMENNDNSEPKKKKKKKKGKKKKKVNIELNDENANDNNNINQNNDLNKVDNSIKGNNI